MGFSSTVQTGFIVVYLMFSRVITGSINRKLDTDSYMTERAKILAEDLLHRTGNDVILGPEELKANAIVAKLKKKELDRALLMENSLPAHMFPEVIEQIEQTDIYRIIKKMPKGALLHTHELSMASYEWIVKNVTYRNTCFMCYNETSKIMTFKMSRKLPLSSSDCIWKSVNEERRHSGNPITFDAELYKNWTFVGQDIKRLYPTQEDIWTKFGGVFTSIGGILNNIDVYKEYYIRGLEELLHDNVQYVEVRALLIPLYDLDGNEFANPEVALKVHEAATNSFISEHIFDFHGAKIIYICLRSGDKETIRDCVKKGLEMKDKYTGIFGGFDLVGQEDPGHTLLYFIDELLLPSRYGKQLPFIFHAGETDWEGQHVDSNLIDAYLLNTSRVGHGFALTKHPELMSLYRERNISAEVSPISNQVLGLISDLRQHPATMFLSQGFPMTVNNDDPAIWGSKGVSHDWFEVFMGMTRQDDDLRLLKRLAMDSIRFSLLDDKGKEQLMTLFNEKWKKFIADVIDYNF